MKQMTRVRGVHCFDSNYFLFFVLFCFFTVRFGKSFLFCKHSKVSNLVLEYLF